MNRTSAALALVALVTAACEQPTETQPLEGVYLVDRVNGVPLPGQICHGDGIDQVLLYESVAMGDNGSYGRLQQVRLGEEEVIQQEEYGEYVRTDSTFLLINAVEDTIVLAMLDTAATRLRRIHPCGDTLRYSQARVEG
ncbi:MAG TPA: hypothetical protein VF039_02855 [Longimicrobiales bacterium]